MGFPTQAVTLTPKDIFHVSKQNNIYIPSIDFVYYIVVNEKPKETNNFY